ncbi:uncharacterized protein LOC105662731 isoform X2 [Megachile rotundata]|uniref:uncharacterized protein LOC105662731 isoform X2 n=1 Tax=Megachile rotundata TaxID=143995 RepID=UPI003FD649DD
MNECFARRLSRTRIEQQEWMNCYFRKLASLYRKSPCLWKKDTRYYLDSEWRHRAYARIHQAMNLPGVTFVEIILKIREMRRLYVNELKRLLRAKSNCRRYEITIPWFYDLHRFLYPYLDYEEAVELHDIDQIVVEPGETIELDGGPSNCSCIDCPLPKRNDRIVNFLPCSRGSCALNSISSPIVSLPEVKNRPRSCSRSCSRINDTRKQLNEFPTGRPSTNGSSYLHENLQHGDTSKQQEEYEFTICGLRSESSSDNSFETDSDHTDDFSKLVSRYLGRLNDPVPLKGQAEISKSSKFVPRTKRIR